MREHIRHFVRICAETLPIAEPIYEFGALQVVGQEGFADLRPFFPGAEYVGADLQSGPGVDRILDLHDLDLPPTSVGTVLMLETLEHVEFPRRAVEEAHRILRPEGLLVASSQMKYPIHGFPSDYWRFTPQAFESLLRPFASLYVESAGSDDFPHTVVGIGFKGKLGEEVVSRWRREVQRWKERWRNAEPDPRTRVGGLARRLLPPIVKAAYEKISGLKSPED